ncbi:hypothetical protein MN608_05294 [Microdochium nivale]|nr:hypothetical protein MN608_05294 [Microdochium nivale]
MLMSKFLALRSLHTIHMAEPSPLFLFGIILSAIAGVICVVLIALRARTVRNWQRLAYMQWFVLFQFSAAACFMIVSVVLRYAYDSNGDVEICRMATKACIIMYTVIKLFYILLADRLHVVRTCGGGRLKSKLYIFHCAFIIATIVVWNIVLYCKGWITLQEGTCVVGAIRDLFVVVIVMDTVLNLYLTIFFLFYLGKSFRISSSGSSARKFVGSLAPRCSRRRAPPPPRQLSAELRTLTVRTVVGLAITLTATMINAVTMIVMNGEAMWFCWIACKADVIINVIVLYWITSPGAKREATSSNDGSSSSSSSKPGGTFHYGSNGSRNSRHSRKDSNVTTTTDVTLTDFFFDVDINDDGDKAGQQPVADAGQKRRLAAAYMASSSVREVAGEQQQAPVRLDSVSWPLRDDGGVSSPRAAAGLRTHNFAEFVRGSGGR